MGLLDIPRFAIVTSFKIAKLPLDLATSLLRLQSSRQ